MMRRLPFLVLEEFRFLVPLVVAVLVLVSLAGTLTVNLTLVAPGHPITTKF
jgi:hypothetical protein